MQFGCWQLLTHGAFLACFGLSFFQFLLILFLLLASLKLILANIQQ